MLRGVCREAWVTMGLLALSQGCQVEPTQLLVVVDTDYAPGVELDSAILRVSLPGRGDLAPMQREVLVLEGVQAARPEAVHMPFSFGVSPRGRVRSDVRIEVTGRRGDTDLVTAAVRTAFVQRRTLRLPIFLYRNCEDVRCDHPDEACVDGECVSVYVDPGDLPQTRPGTELDGAIGPLDGSAPARDAGGAMDAAAVDAGAVDASPIDAGDVDASPMDAGAPSDSGTTGSSCFDGLANELETDVDCGGGRCPPCLGAATCALHTDCASGDCTGGACAPISTRTFGAASLPYRGYRADLLASQLPCPSIVASGTPLGVVHGGWATTEVGFDFPFYEATFGSVHVTSSGGVIFPPGAPTTLGNENACGARIPPSEAYVAAYWDDLDPSGAAGIFFQTMGRAPLRRFVVQWDVAHRSGTEPGRIILVLHETGWIEACYPDTVFGNLAVDQGISATVTIHNTDHAYQQHSCNLDRVPSGHYVRWTPR